MDFDPNRSSTQYPNLLSGSFFLIPQGDTCIDNLTVQYTIATNIEGGQLLTYNGAIDRLWLDNGNYVKDAGDTLITDRTNLDISLGAGVFQQVFFELDSTAIKLAGGSVLSGVAQVNTGTPFASSLTLFG
ncbi:MAG: hypothetical protein HC796_10980 [Synechococcaceae cyanobacterium RL_1_2]|nr:hypothetical protein [Synechococcaceae cyanobacterium RL_1_2]